MSDIVMPQLGETVTEGTITRWFKAVGDAVAQDEPLFEVSTDKVDSEVPSAAAGTLTEILVPEGETVPVGARLAVVSDGAAAPPVAEESAPERPSSPPFSEKGVESGASGSGDRLAPPVPSRSAGVGAADGGSSPAARLESGGGVAPKAPTEPEAVASSGQPASEPSMLLSPVVRRLIAENGLDPAAIAGTGPGGRITRDDALAVIEGRARGRAGEGATPVPPSRLGGAGPTDGAFSPPPSRAEVGLQAPVLAAASGPDGGTRPATDRSAHVPASVARRGDEVVPFSNIRRRTAEHMIRSKATSAHTLAVMEVDFESVEQVRRRHGAAFKAEEGFSLTYLPFLIVATVEAIRTWPQVNASVGEDALIVHHDIHVGIAVDLESEGLIVPVVHDADAKRLRALAREVRDLASRARNKKLTADDIAGGTFTITNPGPFGTLLTAPIINQPQVAILSTDGITRRPVVVQTPGGDEAITIHSVGNLALSFDHRVVDGAYASRFLKTMKELIEGRDWEQEI